MGAPERKNEEQNNNFGLVTVFNYEDVQATDDQPKKKKVNYNSDGTVPIEIFRTGNWMHPRYGNIDVTEKDLETAIKNFNDNVVGYKVTFNYHHERTKNFGTPVRLRTEPRVSKFTNRPFTMLIADTQPTEDGKRDLENGEVFNFSSEVNHNYTHREVVRISRLDKDGNEEFDDSDQASATKNNQRTPAKVMRKNYGMTLLGGAVTNYPFITDLNPNGIGGNLSDEYKFSEETATPIEKSLYDCGGVIVAEPKQLTANNITDRAYSIFDLLFGPRVDTITFSANDFDHIMSLMQDPVFVGSNIYERSEYVAGMDDLPDAAFGITLNKTSVYGVESRVRRFAHHMSNVITSDDHSTVDANKLNSALSVLEKLDLSIAEYSACKAHLDSHKAAISKTINHSIGKEGKMSEENATQNFDFEAFSTSPQGKALLEGLQRELSSKYEQRLTAMEQANAEYKTRIEDLNTQLAQTAEEKVAARREAYALSISQYSDKLLGGKAPASMKSVVRCALANNEGVTVKYFNADKKEVEVISLQDMVTRILSCIPAEGAVVETTATTETTVVVDQNAGGDQAHSVDVDAVYADLVKSKYNSTGKRNFVSATAKK